MMQNQPSHNFSMEQIMAFASSPAGRQLLSALQEKDGSLLTKARSHAQAGDMAKAKESLTSLLSDPKIQQILKQLEG